MAIKDLLTKPPFYRLTNGGKESQTYNKPTEVDKMKYAERKLVGQVMSQADYLEEFYPFSHRVMSDFYFPEFYNYTEEVNEKGEKTQKFYREETFRIGSTIQSLITAQQLVHVTGNDVHWELTNPNVSSSDDERFRRYQKGWLQKNMEGAIYNHIKSEKITADSAIVCFMDKGKFGWKHLSYLNGDTLYPHYDPLTGKMNLFARKFSSYDESGEEVISWVEVWDDKYMRRYRQSKKGLKNVVSNVKDYLGLEGYEKVYEKEHGFSRCPIDYIRNKDNAPCWNMVQCLIDDYEVALSYFAKNNAAAALPSYKMKGDNVEIQGDPLGRVRAFTMGKDDDVSLIQPNGLSENYTKYIEYLLNEIFSGAYIVKQPELKSGDTPTGTMKLYYAPSLDKAILDAKDYKPSIDNLMRLFCEGYGMEQGELTGYLDLSDKIFGWIIPYVHENTSSLIADLVSAKNAGILSTESATEHNFYASNNEFDRITREAKREQEADRLYQLRSRMTVSTQNNR